MEERELYRLVQLAEKAPQGNIEFHLRGTDYAILALTVAADSIAFGIEKLALAAMQVKSSK